ncbi:hypothetical protein GH714_026618 [Hevea brasiliensis]|uniref:Protein kinase domain-containing protein n=1 Tax=Hevea brasiliensis TaxID=3981 RepID=A0A6A6N4B1_HEVBR|nr:hypothetical protein GH714_026618 [Hevea brasiliensis]
MEFFEIKPIKLFVKMMNSEGRTMEIDLQSNDSIKSIHEQILKKEKIPVTEQILFHDGKQLERWQTLEDCSIENEACLELKVGLVRDDSDESSALLQMIHETSSNICRMCRGEPVSMDRVDRKTIEVLMSIGEGNSEILDWYSIPATLVMLYSSPIEGNKGHGDFFIRFAMDFILMSADDNLGNENISLALEFCHLLRNEASDDDPLYQSCRTTLRELLERGNYEIDFNYGPRSMLQIVPFVVELVAPLLSVLGWIFYPGAHIKLFEVQFRDFQTFSRVLRKAIANLKKANEDDECKIMIIVSSKALKVIFRNLLKKMEEHLSNLTDMTQMFESNDVVSSVSSLYLTILNELNSISQLVEGAAEEFRHVLEDKKISLQQMVKNTTRKDDYDWLLEHSALLDSESRMHLVMMKMISEEKLRDAELYKPIILRCKNLFKAFKNKDLMNPKVLQDWLRKLCQVLFKPQNLLFLACPNDPTKFYPNPEFEPQPLHLDYFEISGMVIALALMHEVRVGVAFHRVFLLQVAGKDISAEDVRDAVPSFYKAKEPLLDSHQILNEFLKSVSEQISFFTKGFDSVFGKSIIQLLSHGRIEPEDLNHVLKGNLNLEFNCGKKRKHDHNESDPLMLSQDNERDPLMSQFLKANKQKLNIPKWQKGKILGEGGFGKVYEGYAPSDFGLAKVLELNALMKSSCGTTSWMAPEVIEKNKEYGFKADIWSLGCTVLEMLTWKSPYSHLTCGTTTLECEIENGKLPDLPDFLSDLSRDFITKCLKFNPDDRPTAAELLQHPFVTGTQSNLVPSSRSYFIALKEILPLERRSNSSQNVDSHGYLRFPIGSSPVRAFSSDRLKISVSLSKSSATESQVPSNEGERRGSVINLAILFFSKMKFLLSGLIEGLEGLRV